MRAFFRFVSISVVLLLFFSISIFSQDDKESEDPVISVKTIGDQYMFYLSCHGKNLQQLSFLPCKSKEECMEFVQCISKRSFEPCLWYDTILGRMSTGSDCYNSTEGDCLAVVPPVPDSGAAVCLSNQRAVVNYVVQQEDADGSKKWAVYVGSEISEWGSENRIIFDEKAYRPYTNNIANLTVTRPLITDTLPELEVQFQVGQEGQSLTCRYQGEPSTNLLWLINGKNITEFSKHVLDWPLSTSTIDLGTVRLSTAGNYTLVASNRFGTDKVHFNVTTFHIDPIIQDKSDEEQHRVKTLVKGMENQTLSCKYKGSPTPQLKWYHDNKVLEKNRSMEREMRDDFHYESILTLSNVTLKDAGSYKCQVTCDLLNKSDAMTFNVQVLDGDLGWSDELIYGSVGGGVTFLSIVIVALTLVWRYVWSENHELRRLDKEFHEGSEQSKQLVEGQGEGQGTTGQNLDHNFLTLPFDSKYIIPKTDLKKGARIGQGEYGFVYEGKFGDQQVGIKEPKENTSLEIFKLFLRELKLVSRLGDHENVLKFIGAVTENIRKKKLEIVFEFCPFGDLGSYILERKESFEKIINSPNDILGKKRMLFALFATWCEQICNGMTYLARKKIVHMDLAVRNVLVFTSTGLKISDFGLARVLYKNLYEVTMKKNTEVRVPWKYWAYESLHSGHFTTQTDVWAFGVTAWEIYSMAGTPFPTFPMPTPDFKTNVGQTPEYTLGQPDFCSMEIYEKLKSCWDRRPERRPSFEDLKFFFQQYGFQRGQLDPFGENVNMDWLMSMEDLNFVAGGSSSSLPFPSSTSASSYCSSSPLIKLAGYDEKRASSEITFFQSRDTGFEPFLQDRQENRSDNLPFTMELTECALSGYDSYDSVLAAAAAASQPASADGRRRWSSIFSFK